ncbi:hypothetical protein ACTHGU_08165 [Chitinophagaceae bacterium MMS25-I14]
MSNKALSVICYITIIGWYIAFVQYQNTYSRSTLVAYHLKQSLGLTITGTLMLTVLYMAGKITHLGYILPNIGWLLMLAYMITGIILAAGQRKRPLPLVGGFFSKRLEFIFPEKPQQLMHQR